MAKLEHWRYNIKGLRLRVSGFVSRATFGCMRREAEKGSIQ